MLDFIHKLVAKICNSVGLTTFFVVFAAMELIGSTAVLFLSDNAVFAIVNIVASLLLILFWVDERTKGRS